MRMHILSYICKGLHPVSGPGNSERLKEKDIKQIKDIKQRIDFQR